MVVVCPLVLCVTAEDRREPAWVGGETAADGGKGSGVGGLVSFRGGSEDEACPCWETSGEQLWPLRPVTPRQLVPGGSSVLLGWGAPPWRLGEGTGETREPGAPSELGQQAAPVSGNEEPAGCPQSEVSLPCSLTRPRGSGCAAMGQPRLSMGLLLFHVFMGLGLSSA